MADDGYLIGYEDNSGNFVEVGRFNNLNQNTSDPVFIEHTGSGTRMELDGSGFDMGGGDITNAGSVSTDSGSIAYLANSQIDRRAVYAGSNEFSTINDAIAEQTGQQEIIAQLTFNNPDYTENVVFDTAHAALRGVSGQGAVKLYNSGDHVIEIPSGANDVTIDRFWLEQTDASGSYDAINVRGGEARIQKLGIDAAPRDGIRVNGPNECQIRSVEISNDGQTGLRLFDASDNVVSDVEIKGFQGSQATLSEAALKIEGSSDNNKIDATIHDIDGNGIEDLTGALGSTGNTYSVSVHDVTGYGVSVFRHSYIDGSISDTGGDALKLTGQENYASVSIMNPTGNAVTIDGNRNTASIMAVGGDVVLNGDDTTVTGTLLNGSITDNGTGNDTTNLNVV